MRESEIFQFELGRIEAEFRAITAVMSAEVDSHWQHALGGTLKNDAIAAQTAQTASLALVFASPMGALR
jgi:hypothetical protein